MIKIRLLGKMPIRVRCLTPKGQSSMVFTLKLMETYQKKRHLTVPKVPGTDSFLSTV